jgi:tripartite-type tricarboxylate transporter receptor subunit TctC
MIRALAAATLALTALAGPVRADPIADFYTGKRMSFLISAPAGSGYDTYARLLARHITRHIPGNPGYVAQNMPAAGGMVLLNSVYNTGARDGTVIFTLHFNLPLYQALGGCGVRYDAAKLIGLGRLLASDTAIGVSSSAKSGVKTIADAKKTEVTIGSTGATSNATLYPLIMNNMVGTKFKIVEGYEGENAVFLAMERGEIDGFGSYSYLTFKSVRPDYLTKHLFYPLVQFGAEREQAWPDVPTAIDLAGDETDRRAMALASSGPDIGFSYFMPPGVPAERVAALRQAFADMLADPAFREEADHAKLDLRVADAPTVERIVHDVLTAPRAVTERLRALMRGPGVEEANAQNCARVQEGKTTP